MQNKFMEIITSQNLKATNVEYNVGDTLRIVITSYSIHYTKLYEGAFSLLFLRMGLGPGRDPD